MTWRRTILRRALWLLACLWCAATAASAGDAPRGKPDPTPLTMEQLEVRGVREKPDRLHVPAPKGIFRAAPVRHDLLAEDLGRPILPWEIRSHDNPNGGTP